MEGGTVISTTYSEMVHQKMNHTDICTCIFGVSEGERRTGRERNREIEKGRGGEIGRKGKKKK